MVDWFSAKVQRQFSGEETVFSINDFETIGYLQAKEWTSTHTAHHIQKLSQNGS